MLVLSRKLNETIQIGTDIQIMVVRISHDKVRLGIVAPAEMPVHRGEFAQAMEYTGTLRSLAKPPEETPGEVGEDPERDYRNREYIGE